MSLFVRRLYIDQVCFLCILQHSLVLTDPLIFSFPVEVVVKPTNPTQPNQTKPTPAPRPAPPTTTTTTTHHAEIATTMSLLTLGTIREWPDGRGGWQAGERGHCK